MAAVYIGEVQSIRMGGPAIQFPLIKEQVVAITASSTQSQVFSDNTFFIRVHTDAICSIKIGLNPTATTSTMRLAANQTEYFGVSPNQQIAVIQNV